MAAGGICEQLRALLLAGRRDATLGKKPAADVAASDVPTDDLTDDAGPRSPDPSEKRSDCDTDIFNNVPSLATGRPRLSSPASGPYEEFEAGCRVPSLPLVVFSDDVRDQCVWHNGAIAGGCVAFPGSPPDVHAEDPVVMSPAHLGFAIEPYESRYLHYRGVGIVFARPWGGKFMQPSIDTILMCCALARLFAEGKERGLGFRRAIDVGSGSGFIGKFAAVHAPGEGAVDVTLVDIDPAAEQYYKTAGFGARTCGATGRELSWHFHTGDAVKLLEQDTSFDLVLSNPPYIPTLEETRSAGLSAQPHNFWEGCGLLAHLLELMLHGRCPAGAHLVLSLTSLTLKAHRVRALLAQAPQKGVQVRVLLEREIAWKAFYAGRGSSSFLMATGEEQSKRQRIGDCELFVGAMAPGKSRTGGRRDRQWEYHWHHAYVLDLCRADEPGPTGAALSGVQEL